MEAALRTASYLMTGKNPDPDAFRTVRMEEGWRISELDMAGTKVRVAVSSGLNNARQLLEAIRSGEVQVDFVEIMACPGGCVAGAGTILPIKKAQTSVKQFKDQSKLQQAVENPLVENNK